jgi:hypothetical protein
MGIGTCTNHVRVDSNIKKFAYHYYTLKRITIKMVFWIGTWHSDWNSFSGEHP